GKVLNLVHLNDTTNKSPLSLAIEMENTDVLEYILRSLPSGISWSSGKSPFSLLDVAAKYGHGEISAKIAQYYPFFINKTNNQGDTPLHCAARAGKLNTATVLVDFAKHIPSTSQPPVDLLRMENAMGNTVLREALFMLGRVNVRRTNTA
ncbi:hypothetical protein CISIN_1g041026mg, partial [Citrus sinensis]